MTHLEGESQLVTVRSLALEEKEGAAPAPRVVAGCLCALGFGSALSREFRRYVVAAFLCDTSTLYVLTRFLGLYYLASAVAGFASGLLICRVLNRRWVFERRTRGNTTAEISISVRSASLAWA